MRSKHTIALVVLQWCLLGGADAAPAMFWFNDPVGPDETVLVTGADLDQISSASITRIPDRGSPPTKGQPAQAQETPVDIMQVNPGSLKFVIPKDFTPGVYRFTLHHAQGTLTGRANLPTIYWTQGEPGEAVAPSGQVQLFGRNIIRQPERAQLLLTPETGKPPIQATLVKGDLWRGIFRLPERVAAGSYKLRLFNGDGGDGEFIDAGMIVVRNSNPPPTETFDVRAYGANGNGKTDSTRAIKAAIEAANQNGGGTVYFPRGRYFISEGLTIPPRVSIKGERIDLVNLLWPDFDAPPPALLQGDTRFSIEDITIYASNHLNVISGGFHFRDLLPNAEDIAIRRVRIRASAFRGQMDLEATIQRMRTYHQVFPDGGPDTIQLTGNRLEVSDCDILGSGNSLHLIKATDAVISGNILSNGRNGAYAITGSRRVTFENNVVQGTDLQATGGAVNALSKWVTASENIYVGNNTFKDVLGWDREAMTTDAPAGYYFGHAETTSPRELSLPDAPDPNPAAREWTGALVMVVNGRGAGQSAHVASYASSPQWIALDRILQVPLDATSEITVVQAQENYLVIGNTFEDVGVAAQAFGTAIGHVFAGNQSNRTSGFAVIGLNYGHFQPCWRIQILDNHILEGNVYRAGPDRNTISNEALIFVRANQTTTEPRRPPFVDAVIVRGNRLDQDAHIQIEGFSTASPGIRDIVVEANETGPSRIGLVIDRGVAYPLVRRNVEGRRIGK